MTVSHLSTARLSPGDADALLFDLGRVVINIDFSKALACWAGHARCQSRDLAARYAPDETYFHHERGTVSDQAFFDNLRRLLGIAITDEQFLEGWNAVFAGEMEGITPLLERAAKHLPLYAFSNTNRPHVAHFSKAYADLLKPFRELYLSSTIGMRKPEAAAFDHVVGAIGVPASRIVFFDDLAENIEGARARGLKAVHVTSTRDIADALTALGI
jgi:HAD superfamily hydrolase (TIGR01509 family)